MHQTNRRARTRDQPGHIFVKAQSRNVIDPISTCRHSSFGHASLSCVDRQWQGNLLPQSGHGRDCASNFIGHIHIICPRPRAFSANIDYIGPVSLHSLRMGHSSGKAVKLTTVREAIRCCVDNTHDLRARHPICAQIWPGDCQAQQSFFRDIDSTANTRLCPPLQNFDLRKAAPTTGQ